MYNYSQDCILPYGPMKLNYNDSNYRHLKYWNDKILKILWNLRSQKISKLGQCHAILTSHLVNNTDLQEIQL